MDKRGGRNHQTVANVAKHRNEGQHRERPLGISDALTFGKNWRPYRESNPGYLREREVS